ncbi:MAG: Coenzyme F420 hydrogenase/dehydrogenase, beta subunit C-terminal domain [Planctomycetota bacterium]
MKRPNGIQDVLEHRLCVGCGACAYASGGAVKMHHVFEEGWRPRWREELAIDVARRCAAACPVVDLDSPGLDREEDALSIACRDAGLGPVRKIWEVHATDADLRFRGASGGALSALSVHGLDEGCGGVLHVAQSETSPFRNETVLSRSRDELLVRTGSRYSPTKLCADLDLLRRADAPCVVIGQPSEIAGFHGLLPLEPELRERTAVTLSFFCAGAPAAKGTWDLIRAHGVEPSDVRRIRYRGRGWPGHFAVWVDREDEPVLELTYAESWSYVQSYRTWGVHLWPDGAGEAADVSCGDPWYREIEPGEPGSSLVIARTERGEAFVQRAIDAGALSAAPIRWEQVRDSQTNLLDKKANMPGRYLAMRLLGLRAPRYANYGLAPLWSELPLVRRVRIVLGTMRRLIQRGHLRRAVLEVPREVDDPTAAAPLRSS